MRIQAVIVRDDQDAQGTRSRWGRGHPRAAGDIASAHSVDSPTRQCDPAGEGARPDDAADHDHHTGPPDPELSDRLRIIAFGRGRSRHVVTPARTCLVWSVGDSEQDVREYGQDGEQDECQFWRALDGVLVVARFHRLDLSFCRGCPHHRASRPLAH